MRNRRSPICLEMNPWKMQARVRPMDVDPSMEQDRRSVSKRKEASNRKSERPNTDSVARAARNSESATSCIETPWRNE